MRLLRFAELVDKQCGAGFSLRGTSVPLERHAGTCGRRAKDRLKGEMPTGNIESPVVDEARGLTGGKVTVGDGEQIGDFLTACLVRFDPAVFEPVL